MAKEREAKVERVPPIERMGYGISRSVERWFPDPFLFAIILLFVVFIMAWAIQGSNPYECMQYMYKGFWAFLAFAMQMCLILLLGYAIAVHPGAVRVIKRLCGLPRNGKQAAALVALISCLFARGDWGLGVLVGALRAREVARDAHERGMAVH